MKLRPVGHYDNKCDTGCGEIWKAAIQTGRGQLYLCGECASQAIEDRDSRKPGDRQAFSRLVTRILGAPVAAA